MSNAKIFLTEIELYVEILENEEKLYQLAYKEYTELSPNTSIQDREDRKAELTAIASNWRNIITSIKTRQIRISNEIGSVSEENRKNMFEYLQELLQKHISLIEACYDRLNLLDINSNV